VTRRLAVLFSVTLIGACGPPAPDTASAPAAAPAPPRGPRPLRDVVYERTPQRRERGRYLTESVLQCFLCHSDRDWTKPGGPPIAGRKGAGHIWEDRPWLVSPNLTPDRETGAGTWTDDMFARAIREGIGHDGRVLHSQMWYDSFRSLSDGDIASVIVYLRSLTPVRNPLPVTKLPADRPPLVATEQLAAPVPAPDLSTPETRGAYLVRIADCEGCHTAWEAPLIPGLFGGGNRIDMFGRPSVFSANLTSAPSGIGAYYDAALFREVLRAGRLKGRALSPLMPWVAFGRMNDEDLDAIFAYLRSRHPVNHLVSNIDDPTPCPMCGQRHGLGDRNHPKIRDARPLDPRALRDYTGTYRFTEGSISITSDGRNLLVGYDADPKPVVLSQLPNGEFTTPEIPDYFRFRRDAAGRVSAIVLNGDEVAPRIH